MATSYPPSSSPDRRQFWIQGALIVGFWVCFFMLTVGQRAFDPWGPRGIHANEVIFTGIEFLLWLLITPAVLWFSRRHSIEGETWRRNLLLHLGVAIVVAVGVNSLHHVMIHTLFPDAPRRFTFINSVLSLRFLDELVIYLTVLAAGIARDYFMRYQERQKEAAELRAQAADLKTHATRLEAQLSDARLQTLRMQINPHFLFNTLHTISTYLEQDPRGARRMIARLSELLRYTLDSDGTQEVPLRQELAFLDGYLEIQRIRFQNRLVIEHDVSEDAAEALVPNLILQPLVENAIKHGVSAVEDVGVITIRAWRDRERLHLAVEDNGPGLESGNGHGKPGVGLRNTRERLASLYGEDHWFELEPSAAGGVTAHVAIPFHTYADLYTATV